MSQGTEKNKRDNNFQNTVCGYKSCKKAAKMLFYLEEINCF